MVSVVMFGGLMASGYLLMTYTTPTQEQILNVRVCVCGGGGGVDFSLSGPT